MALRSASASRLDWVDLAKGISIVLVVMMHSVLGTEIAAGREGFMHAAVAFAKPFRIPAFFLVAGLFAGRALARETRRFVDGKVVHFAYFYVLWVTIQIALKAPAFAAEGGWPHVARIYVEAFVEPFGTLWFIYLLPVFFIVARLTRDVPPYVVLGAALALETMRVASGWTAIDEFAARFVYFYAGYLFAPTIIAFASRVATTPLLTAAGLIVWAFAHLAILQMGWSELQGVSLALGFAGALAVVAIASCLATQRAAAPLKVLGAQSLAIYLAFFLPMAVTRVALVKTGIVADVGAMSLIVTIAAIVGALAIWWLSMRLGVTFLFVRPAAFRLRKPATVATA